jgi:dienelactone hydrolase
MSEGYAVFEPDAFARPGYACEKSSISTRRAEVAYALAQIRELPWVDQDRIVLMGNSQGGRTAALWDQPGFSAHIIVAASCLSSGGANQYAPRAPDNVPVLTIVGSMDEGYAKPNCQVDRSVGGSRSVVIAGAGHDIMGHPELKQAVKSFLRTCCQ